MENKILTPAEELINVLDSIKVDLELVNDCKNERDKVVDLYKSKLVPNLLRLRKLNRLSKDALESKYDQVCQINQKLANLNGHCENLIFEAACLESEVSSVKQRLSPRKQPTMDDPFKDDFFDPEKVNNLEHDERIRQLEAEVAKRKQLCENLFEVKNEAEKVEQLHHESQQQINRVKPYIKQLLDKVDVD